MTKFNNILFDLDGTLIDSGHGIINAVKYALQKYNINENNMDILKSFVGPPLYQQFTNCYHFSSKESTLAIKYFRQYYKSTGILENTVYQGIPQLLQKLKSLNKKLFIATSKPEKFAKEILAQHDLIKYFDFIGGSLFDGTRVSKTDVLTYVLKYNNLNNPNNCVMIGDRKFDILGAKQFKISTIGVTYGYGNKTELIDAKADFIVDSPEKILNIISSN